jgi:hypothetical protein
MRKSLHSKKMQLTRETLRNLETTRMSEVAGASATCTTLTRTTGASNCYVCTSVDASLCACD